MKVCWEKTLQHTSYKLAAKCRFLWCFQRENQFCNGGERKKKPAGRLSSDCTHNPSSQSCSKFFLLNSALGFLWKEQASIVNPFQCYCLNRWVWYCYCQGILVTVHNINVNSSDCANPFSSCSNIFEEEHWCQAGSCLKVAAFAIKAKMLPTQLFAANLQIWDKLKLWGFWIQYLWQKYHILLKHWTCILPTWSASVLNPILSLM